MIKKEGNILIYMDITSKYIVYMKFRNLGVMFNQKVSAQRKIVQSAVYHALSEQAHK